MSSSIIPAPDALTRLREGNARFVANVRSIDALASLGRRIAPLERQRPFAIIIGCADSRAPAEAIFDQGLGELFVIRRHRIHDVHDRVVGTFYHRADQVDVGVAISGERLLALDDLPAR